MSILTAAMSSPDFQLDEQVILDHREDTCLMYPAGTVLAKTLEALPCHNVEAMRVFTRVGLIALREAANNYFTAKLF
jgi:hypothetical protein